MSEYCNELAYGSFGRRIHATAVENHIPLIGSIALTYRCNLQCRHCYLQGCSELQELTTEAWLDVIDQVAEAGCLWLLITGGEPLLRPDFEQIYVHAKESGLLVIVFTNGTLIDDSIIALWRSLPPHLVEISLYGYTQSTYTKMTGARDAHQRCFQTVEALARASIPMKLKAMATNETLGDIEQLRKYCHGLGVEFRFDTMVSAGLHGDKAPCAARLDPDCVLHLENDDEKRNKGWARFLDEMDPLPPRKTLFSCGAGVTSFFVGPDGALSLCSYDLPVYDLKEGSFLAGWQGPVRERRAAPLPEDHPCLGCRDGVFCGVCTPIARMETGDELGWPQSLCELGKKRAQLICSAVERRTEYQPADVQDQRHE